MVSILITVNVPRRVICLPTYLCSMMLYIFCKADCNIFHVTVTSAGVNVLLFYRLKQ
jgi:hypothetical protein